MGADDEVADESPVGIKRLFRRIDGPADDARHGRVPNLALDERSDGASGPRSERLAERARSLLDQRMRRERPIMELGCVDSASPDDHVILYDDRSRGASFDARCVEAEEPARRTTCGDPAEGVPRDSHVTRSGVARARRPELSESEGAVELDEGR